MLNLKVTAKKYGATLLGRINNAGSWKKIQAVRSVEAGNLQIELITLAQAENAVEKVQAWIDAHPQVNMRVDAATAVATYRKQAQALEAELA